MMLGIDVHYNAKVCCVICPNM